MLMMTMLMINEPQVLAWGFYKRLNMKVIGKQMEKELKHIKQIKEILENCHGQRITRRVDVLLI